MKILKWIDRNLWAVPLACLAVTILSVSVWDSIDRDAVLLRDAPQAVRQQVYASIAGSSSGLLGFTIAAVAILAAFGPRRTSEGQLESGERSVISARNRLVGSLLVTSGCLLALLIISTIGIALDLKRIGNPVIVAGVEGFAVAGAVGLIVGTCGMALYLVDRSRP